MYLINQGILVIEQSHRFIQERSVHFPQKRSPYYPLLMQCIGLSLSVSAQLQTDLMIRGEYSGLNR